MMLTEKFYYSMIMDGTLGIGHKTSYISYNFLMYSFHRDQEIFVSSKKIYFVFQGPDWQYRTELPAWAKENWIDPEDYS